MIVLSGQFMLAGYEGDSNTDAPAAPSAHRGGAAQRLHRQPDRQSLQPGIIFNCTYCFAFKINSCIWKKFMRKILCALSKISW